MGDMFGQFETNSLSDEALGLAPQRQEDATQTQDENPEQEDTTESTQNEVNEPEPQLEQGAEAEHEDAGSAEEPPQEQTGGTSSEDYAKLEKQYRDLRAWSTRLSQENSRLRKAEQQQPQEPSTPPKSPKEFLRDLVNGGEEGFNAAVDARAREIVAPLLQEREQERQNQAFQAAFAEMQGAWTQQLNNPDGQQQLIQRMVEMADEQGDISGWRRNPRMSLFEAALDLWGIPKVVDQEAIDAAVKTATAAEPPKPNKAGLAISPQSNKGKEALSVEQQIQQEILAAGHRGFFS